MSRINIINKLKMSKEILYKYKGKNYSVSDIIRALNDVGIEQGDTIFVHSDVSIFGKIQILERRNFLEKIIKAFKQVIGSDGTLILPTFSYSFCENEVYDMNNSRSKVGALTEYFRKLPDVKRTINPIFSVGVYGKQKEKYMGSSKDCFDDDSIFGELLKNKAKVVFFGAPFQSCTFMIHIEQKFKVPYRFIKKFKGIIKTEEKEYRDEYTYYVRYLDRDITKDFSKFESCLVNNGTMKKVKLGNGSIMAVKADSLFKEGVRNLKKDVNFFLLEEPKCNNKEKKTEL
jgi:aminoglycoside 3-N-acetyltransferase